ncbi:MAG: DUF3047 domain-containing protein [Desulfohalobiaceae bacterium]|nr:DUF3047 domain-containing protein [Desulfohalobiaceae bacterium]
MREAGTIFGEWLFYKRNLYKDFKMLYKEEPRLIFPELLNDTDQTVQEATS